VPPGAPSIPDPAAVVAHEALGGEPAQPAVETGEVPVSIDSNPGGVEAGEDQAGEDQAVGKEYLDTAPLELPQGVETASAAVSEAPKADKADVGE
jgi:hypothetical protein